MQKLQGHRSSQALYPVASASWFIQPIYDCSDIVLTANKLVDMWGCVQHFMAAHDSEESNRSPNQRVAGSEIRRVGLECPWAKPRYWENHWFSSFLWRFILSCWWTDWHRLCNGRQGVSDQGRGQYRLGWKGGKDGPWDQGCDVRWQEITCSDTMMMSFQRLMSLLFPPNCFFLTIITALFPALVSSWLLGAGLGIEVLYPRCCSLEVRWRGKTPRTWEKLW